MSAPVAWTIGVAAVCSTLYWEQQPLLPAKLQPADDSEESEVLQEDEESELEPLALQRTCADGPALDRQWFSG